VKLISTRVLGVDFTSAPSPRKPIVVARGELRASKLTVTHIDRLNDFDAFDALLAEPGPWVGAFDLPFGLPRELVDTMNWPARWSDLTLHLQKIGKGEFKDALNAVRMTRPMGARYIPRKGDAAAGSSSPMKLVNPPVGLMFFEGAPRIARSGVSVIPCAPSVDTRVALEAYPGFLARQITKESYKKDGPEGRSPSRRSNRGIIVHALLNGHTALGELAFNLPEKLVATCVEDGNGDALDAVLCAAQAAIALGSFQRGASWYGVPTNADPLEGWIATVPAS
jgi:Protein of unknown function (DUF429)